MEFKHFLSDIDVANQIATCRHCGLQTKVRYRKDTGRWICRGQDTRKSHARPVTWIKKREELIETQAGKCGLCSRKRKLVLDHCHRTGVVREAICNPCNAGLGIFQDDPVMFQKAIDYIRKHSQKVLTKNDIRVSPTWN